MRKPKNMKTAPRFMYINVNFFFVCKKKKKVGNNVLISTLLKLIPRTKNIKLDIK